MLEQLTYATTNYNLILKLRNHTANKISIVILQPYNFTELTNSNTWSEIEK